MYGLSCVMSERVSTTHHPSVWHSRIRAPNHALQQLESPPVVHFLATNRCCMMANTRSTWPVLTYSRASRAKNARNNFTRPGMLPFCCHQAGMSKGVIARGIRSGRRWCAATAFELVFGTRTECVLGRVIDEDAQVELEKECRLTIDVLLQDDHKRAKSACSNADKVQTRLGSFRDALGMSISAHISACRRTGKKRWRPGVVAVYRCGVARDDEVASNDAYGCVRSRHSVSGLADVV